MVRVWAMKFGWRLDRNVSRRGSHFKAAWKFNQPFSWLWEMIFYDGTSNQILKVVPGSHLTPYGDVIMGAMASQITSLTIVYSTVYSGTDQRKHQSPASQAFLCAGNSPVTSEFPTQKASNAENVSIWWRHHDTPYWEYGEVNKRKFWSARNLKKTGDPMAAKLLSNERVTSWLHVCSRTQNIPQFHMCAK